MAKSPNMKPANNNWSINWTWQQPYLPTSYNPFYERTPKAAPQERDRQVTNLLYDLECIDQQVNEMLTYPDAEAIINKVKQNKGNTNV